MATSTPRKPAAKRTGAAATAARREAGGKNAVLKVVFRRQTFEVPIERLAAGNDLRRRIIAAQTFGDRDSAIQTAELVTKHVFKLLGREQAAKFLDLIEQDEGLGAENEFMAALNKAAGVPNS